MDAVRDRIRDFIRRLVPKQLYAYIPGPKLVAGLILAGLSELFGIAGNEVVSIPGVGEVTVAALALVVGYYFWPESDDPDAEMDLAAEFSDLVEVEDASDDGEMPTKKAGYPDHKNKARS